MSNASRLAQGAAHAACPAQCTTSIYVKFCKAKKLKTSRFTFSMTDCTGQHYWDALDI